MSKSVHITPHKDGGWQVKTAGVAKAAKRTSTQKEDISCKFEIDFKTDRARVQEELRGVIARIYLYFNKQYEMKLSKQELQKYQIWNREYPTSEWERERNRRITEKQGNDNKFITLQE